MKELTIEEKAKAYDESLERARIWQNNLYDANDKDYADELNYIFPELAESEDERIRKEIVRFIQMEVEDEIVGNKWLAWLEKQGEQNLIIADSPQLGEQKSTEIEPKFKIGDWVVYNKDICQIVKREEGCNILVTQFGVEKEPVNERNLSTAKLWDISDAKNGDVLSYRDGQWIFIYKGKLDDNSFYYHTLYSTIHQDLTINDAGFTLLCDAITPATKEQRDLLFAKMKEAGCMFDFKNKEFKKIKNEITIPFGAKDSELQEATYYIPKGFYAEIDDDDKVVIKKGEKPAEWGEEDEHRFKDTIYFLDTAKKHYASTVELEACIDWLKSLKQRIGE